MPIPSEIQSLVDRLDQELGEIERKATEGLNLVRPILSNFPDNVRLIQSFEGITMKELPNEKKLDELLSLAKDFEQQAISLYELATEIDEKWRVRLESKRKAAIEKSGSLQD
jgi:hypothetical protein